MISIFIHVNNICIFLNQGNSEHIVHHFHFLSWPDHDVPDSAEKLALFIKAIRNQFPPNNKNPIVVHCSAGVGRTGTFIAIDQLIQNMHNNDYVDIFGTAYSLRKNRPLMVFDRKLYIFIYKFILDIIQNKIFWNFE